MKTAAIRPKKPTAELPLATFIGLAAPVKVETAGLVVVVTLPHDAQAGVGVTVRTVDPPAQATQGTTVVVAGVVAEQP